MQQDWFSKNGKWLFLLILLIKGGVTLYTILQDYITEIPGTFALCTGDCISYIEPAESLVDNGLYSPDYRLPGYSLVYVPLYFLFSQATALNLLVVVQLIMDIVSAFVLLCTIWLMTNNKITVLAGLLFYGLGCTITVYNKFILSEVVAASFMIFSLYFLVKELKTGQEKYLFFASLFIVWSYFCRPIFFPLFLLQMAYVIYRSYLKKSMVPAFYFLIPFMVFQGMWMARNYIQKDKIYLLSETIYYPGYSSSMLASWEFIGTFDDFKKAYFFPDTEWTNRNTAIDSIDSIKFPDYIYTDDFNEDSLIALRNIAKIMSSDTISAAYFNRLDEQFTTTLSGYTKSVKKNHFWLVYVKTPFERLIHHTVMSSGVQHLFSKTFSDLNFIEKLIKLFFVLIYQLCLYSSLFFVLKIAFFKSPSIYYLFAISCIYAFTIHPVFIGTSDVRYLYGFYPLIALSGALLYDSLKNIKPFYNLNL